MRYDKLDEDDQISSSIFSFREPEPLSLSLNKNESSECIEIPFSPITLEDEFFSFGPTSLPIDYPNMDQSYIRAPEVTHSVTGPTDNCQPKDHGYMFSPNIESAHSNVLQNRASYMNFTPHTNEATHRLPNPVNVGYRVADMHHTMNLGQNGNFCNNEVNFPEQFDGSFLTLGTGNKQEISSIFSTQEIESKLEEVNNSESTRNHTNIPTFQDHIDSFSSVDFNPDEWDTQLYENSSYAGNNSYVYTDPHLYNNNSSYISHYGSNELSGSTSRSANHPWITPQAFPTNDINTPIDSSISSRMPIHRGTQYFNGNSIPHSHLINTQPSVKVNPVQNHYRHVPQVTMVQQYSNPSFPRRLGVQSNDSVIQTHNQGNVHQTQSLTRAQLLRNYNGSAFQHGLPQVNTTLQYNNNVQTSFPIGQVQGNIPVQNPQDHVRSNYMQKVDASQATNAYIRPRVKRRASVPPTVTSLTQQRRKITPQPQTQPIPIAYVPGPRPVSVISPISRSKQVEYSPSHYIKSEGIEETREALGYKCLICKRDLLYAPEGPFEQPDIPPPVAVLSCGHTFHDHCLQNITPQDQSKDPPCIPCAIGER